jgi:hypothetical protein
MKILCLFLFLWVSCSHFKSSERFPTSEQELKHVILIGIDGLGSEYLKKANTPNLKKLMSEGSYTYDLRPTLPYESSPNWYSILSGMKDHGLDDFNKKPRDFHWLSTLFKTLKLQRPSQETGAFYDWKRIEELFEKSYLDKNVYKITARGVALSAGKYISSKKASFIFTYFGQLDVAGHRSGFGSKEYMKTLEYLDKKIGHLITKVDQSDKSKNTVVMVVSDRGGKGKRHRMREESDEEFVPFIIKGDGIKKNYKIEKDIFNYDIAPTIAALLGIDFNKHWSGKVVEEIFETPFDVDEISFYNVPIEKEVFPISQAALNYGNGNVYFFHEGSFSRFALNNSQYLSGPNSNWNFVGLSRLKNGPNNLDSSFYGGDGYVYFTKGKNIIRFNIKTNKVSTGYPKRITNLQFNGLGEFMGDRLDCAFYFGNDIIYFFKGDKVLAVDSRDNEVVKGFPRFTSDVFSDLSKFDGGAKDFDSCINWSNGKAYFFKKDQLIRIDLKQSKMDESYPIKLK